MRIIEGGRDERPVDVGRRVTRRGPRPELNLVRGELDQRSPELDELDLDAAWTPVMLDRLWRALKTVE